MGEFTAMHDKGTAAEEIKDSLFVPNEMANKDGIYPSQEEPQRYGRGRIYALISSNLGLLRS